MMKLLEFFIEHVTIYMTFFVECMMTSFFRRTCL